MHLEAPQGQQGGVLGCSSFVSAQAPTQESFQARYFFLIQNETTFIEFHGGKNTLPSKGR